MISYLERLTARLASSQEREPAQAAERLLLLLPFPPRLDATHGGSRATGELLQKLAAHHRVALFYLRSPDEAPIDPQLAAACEIVLAVPRPPLQRTWKRRVRLLVGLLRGRPMWVTDWNVPTLRERLRAVVPAWQPTIVQIEFHVMAQYLDALDDCSAPRILVEHEPGVGATEALIRSLRGPARLLCWLDGLAWKRFERRIMARVQQVVVFTEADRQVLQGLAGSTPIMCIPLGIRLPERLLDPIGKQPPTLLFVGGFGHPPNHDAAERLMTEIFPRVRRRFPHVRLTIVGSDPPLHLRRIAGEDAFLTGRVPDVTPYLDEAAVVVLPLRLGGGMRVKTLEALANGKALVASPLAVEGLAVRDGEQFLLADSNLEFERAISRLLADPAEREALARRAGAWARRHLGWENPVRAYEQLYQSLTPYGMVEAGAVLDEVEGVPVGSGATVGRNSASKITRFKRGVLGRAVVERTKESE